MKLKKILDYLEARPLASDAALAIIIGSLPKGIQNKNTNSNSISDVFLQTAYLRKRYSNRTLLNKIQDILNTGAKYNLALDTPRISINHNAQLPVWHHLGKLPRTRGHEYRCTAKCLRLNHEVNTVADLLTQESQYEHPLHLKSNDCTCPTCNNYCSSGCPHPNSCLKEASHLLQDISPKFSPHKTDHLDDESPSPEDVREALNHTISHPEGIKLFNQNLKTTGDIHENF